MKLNGIKLTWLGHSAFHIETPGGKHLLIDPFLTHNPKTPANKKNFAEIDVILCTHGHTDHIADAADLAKKHNSKVVGIYELCIWLQKKGAEQIAPMNKGGTQAVGDIKVSMVHANHSNAVEHDNQLVYGGEPAGFVITFENGLRIYHAGDTNVFGDMAIIRDIYRPDLAILPIGDVFTMGPKEAAYACRLLAPKAVIPMHWGTFPMLTGTPAEFGQEIKSLGLNVELIAMEPGETIS
jgi:L-ascorbate metabolism protein UlaG (beta-lactamase superfamily)